MKPSEIKLIEVEPGRFVIEREKTPPARSTLPCPYIISDIMEPVEQIDGCYYTSKRKFRAVGRAHGLVEIGNEKLKPKVRSTDLPETKRARRGALKIALEKFKAGHRPRRETL